MDMNLNWKCPFCSAENIGYGSCVTEGCDGALKRVFDATAWCAVGHDVGNNDIFRKPAMVVHWYPKSPTDQMADVIFLDNPSRISRGHFVSSFIDV